MDPLILNKLASRKFWLAAIIVLSSPFLLVYKYLEPATYVDLNVYVIGLYFATNVSQDVIKDFLSKRSVAIDSVLK